MPCRPSPRSLRQTSLNAVAHNFESICYGAAKGTKELHRLIETDTITQYDSPFREWPSSLLADLSDAIYRVVESHIQIGFCSIKETLHKFDRMSSYTNPKLIINLEMILKFSPHSCRSGQKHLLYHVVQPQIIEYSIKMHGSIHVAMNLVSKR